MTELNATAPARPAPAPAPPAPDQVWLNYPVANEALGLLRELYDEPKSWRAPGMLIYGQTNNGKTSLVRWFQSSMNKTAPSSREADQVPVAYVQAPPISDVRYLCAMILESIGIEPTSSGGVSLRVDQVRRGLPRVGVRMLIIDEVHDLLDGAHVHLTFLAYE